MFVVRVNLSQVVDAPTQRLDSRLLQILLFFGWIPQSPACCLKGQEQHRIPRLEASGVASPDLGPQKGSARPAAFPHIV